MPIISNINLDDKTVLAVWHATETIEELVSISHYAKTLLTYFSAQYKSESRLKEKVLSRLLLIYVYENYTFLSKSQFVYPEIMYNSDGKPILSDGYKISISHTKDYVAIIVSSCYEVGIDIEQRTERVNRIADKFLREDEKALTTDEKLLIWSGKETVYKRFSNLHLELKEMRSFDMNTDLDNDSSFFIENIRTGEICKINYRIGSDYVLTYTIS